jgi:hypothetical protein
MYRASAGVTDGGRPVPGFITGFSGILEDDGVVMLQISMALYELIESRLDVFQLILPEFANGRMIKYRCK